MKRCLLCIISLLIHIHFFSHAMDGGLEIKPSLACIARRLDKATWKLHQALSSDEEEFRIGRFQDLARSYKAQMGGKSIPWPSKEDNRVDSVDLSYKKLHSLRTLYDRSSRVIFWNMDMPSYIDTTMLSTVDVSHNRLQEIQLWDILEACPNLLVLDASHNDITYIATHKIVDDNNCTRGCLTLLNLKNNDLTKLNIGKLMERCPSETIDVSSNCLLEKITWKCNLKPTCSSFFPRVIAYNTPLSLEKKEAFIDEYMQLVRSTELRRLKFGSLLIGALAQGAVPYIFPLIESPLAAGVVAACLACGMKCLSKSDELDAKEQEMRNLLEFPHVEDI